MRNRFSWGRCAIVVASTLLASGVASAQEAGAKRPNIIWIYADDHAVQAVGAYGSEINETPNIDRLAEEGVLFRNSFVTNSICAPARAVVLTGLHSHRNGVLTNRDEFDGSQRTFVKLLGEAGYQTAVVGKWHLKSDPAGFDHWDVLIGQGPYYNPPMKSAGGVTEHEGYTTDIITDKALAWLKEGRDERRPFMLMLQHKAPHRSWQPGPEQMHDFEDVDLREPATLFDDYAGRASPAAEQEMTIARHLTGFDLKLRPPGNLTDEQREAWEAAYGPKNERFEELALEGDALTRWKYQRYVKDYLRTINSVDENLGRLLAYLDESGLADETIVFYSSDQGFYLGEHGWFDKRWMYEESFRTPLIVRWPGVAPEGVERRELVQNLDMAPTFLEIAGAEIPEDMQGLSVATLIRGEEAAWPRQSLYYHYYEFPAVHMVARHYGVRTDRYKLIHYYQSDEWEMFDLQVDPHELRSVHDDPRYAEVRGRLEAELQRLREQYGDETATPPPAEPQAPQDP